VNWLWDFGDGQIDYSQNPSHVYTDTGAFDIFLVVWNQTGCRDTAHASFQLLAAKTDIWVSFVEAEVIDGFLDVRTGIGNTGTRDISKLNLDANIEGLATHREIWNGTLLPGDTMIYHFISKMEINETNDPDYICVAAFNICIKI